MNSAVQKPERIVALDVARGIAILGTLATNIWIFADPSAVQKMLHSGGGASLAEEVARGGAAEVVDAVLHLVTDGKFLGLLTIMFGIGMEIQRQSAERKGETWPGRYYRRAALLALEGLLNYIFVFEYDVLMGYGLTALAIAPILARSERVQKAFMWAALTVHVVVIIFLDYSLHQFTTTASEAEIAEATRSTSLYDSTASYPGMVQARVVHFLDGRFEIPILVMMGLGTFLVGARLYRAGLFVPERPGLRRAVLLFGLGVGLPVDWCLRFFATSLVVSSTRYITSAVVAFGLLALIAEYYVRRGNRLGAVGRALTVVGRMALTCYILQNLIASVLFHDFGFGLSGTLNRPYGVLATYLLICAVLVGFSAVWLRRFERGPVETVMHRLYT